MSGRPLSRRAMPSSRPISVERSGESLVVRFSGAGLRDKDAFMSAKAEAIRDVERLRGPREAIRLIGWAGASSRFEAVFEDGRMRVATGFLPSSVLFDALRVRGPAQLARAHRVVGLLRWSAVDDGVFKATVLREAGQSSLDFPFGGGLVVVETDAGYAAIGANDALLGLLGEDVVERWVTSVDEIRLEELFRGVRKIRSSAVALLAAAALGLGEIPRFGSVAGLADVGDALVGYSTPVFEGWPLSTLTRTEHTAVGVAAGDDRLGELWLLGAMSPSYVDASRWYALCSASSAVAIDFNAGSVEVTRMRPGAWEVGDRFPAESAVDEIAAGVVPGSGRRVVSLSHSEGALYLLHALMEAGSAAVVRPEGEDLAARIPSWAAVSDFIVTHIGDAVAVFAGNTEVIILDPETDVPEWLTRIVSAAEAARIAADG